MNKQQELVSSSKKRIQQTIERLGERLEQGYSQEMKAYLSAMARFYSYSFGNQILIIKQCPQASHVAGFRAWNRLNRFVRKGEKSIRILAPCIIKREEEKKDPLVLFKTAAVFDISQTDGEDLPEGSCTKGEPGVLISHIEQVIRDRSIILSYEKQFSRKGYSAKGRIVIDTELRPAEQFSVLVHELAHEILHQTVQEKPEKETMELEADAIACVVCERFGLEAINASADYIVNWKGCKDSLLQRMETIRSCASTIIQNLEDLMNPTKAKCPGR